MARTVVHTLFLMQLSCVTGQLQIYQGRVVTSGTPGVEVWRVEGVATVELGGANPPTYYFDCNSTVNNGSGITWSRLGGAQIRFSVSEVGNGKRMDARDFRYEDLGEYSCRDQRTNNELILNITDSNPAVCPAMSSVGITQGLSTTLEVYISGYPPVRSTNVHWYRLNPTRQEITSGATFHDSRRRMVLTDVQTSDTGMYLCEATIPLIGITQLRASATIDLQVYVPSTIVDQPQNMSVVAEWSNLTLRCSATGSPLPTIIWEREGGTPLPVDTRQTSVTDNSLVTSTLTFPELGVRYDDRGRYRCVASNPHTASASSNYTLVSITPTLRLSAAINGQAQQVLGDLLFAPEGSVVMVECFGSGTLQWQNSSGSRILSDSQSVIYQQADPTRSVQTLNIGNFTQDTIDTYTCMSDLTTGGQTPVQLPLFITSSNPAVFISAEIQYVLAGNTTSLVATVHAHPSVDVAGWYLNNTPIDTGGHYTVSVVNTMHTLRIQNVEEDQLGLYEFVATVGNQTASDSIQLVFPNPPMSSISPSTITTNIGDQVQFQCQVGGSEPLNVEWRLADGSIPPSGVVQSGNDIVIAQVESSHAGTYVCSVQNLVGTVEDRAVLNVFHPPTVVIIYQQISATPSSPHHIDLTDGGEGPTFSCTADGYLSPVLLWRRGDGLPLPDGVDSVNVSGREQPVLELRWSRNLRFTDSGSYVCMAVNDNGTSTAELDVLVRRRPLIFVPPVDQYEINNGSSAVFQCEASGVPAHDVFWTFTNFNGSTVFIIDTTLPDMDKYQIKRMRGIGTGFGELTVLNVQYEDRGTYTCTAMNIIGSDTSDANLTVHVYPVINNVSSLTEVNVSLPTSLVCLTTGFPLPSITWQKEGEEVMFTFDGRISAFHFGIGSGSSSFESSGFVGNGTIEGLLEAMTEFNMNDIRSLGELVVVSVLRFDHLERGDTANYTCTATNMLPQTTTLTALSPSIPLVVLEVPDPPIDVMAFATGACWLALRWTSTFDGNRPITSFIIYQQDINVASSFMPVGMLEVGSLMFRNGSFRYNIFEDIIPFNNYQFTVQACNVLGCGNVSSPSPTAMTLPDIVEPIDNTSVPITTTANFRLRLKPVRDCVTWVDESRSQKFLDIVSAVVQSVQGDCSCNFTEVNIQNFEFSCRSIENTVVFRAEIAYTAFGEDPAYTADGLVALVSTWAQSGTSISVDSTRLDVDPSCPTQLESFEVEDCESETVTGEPGGTSVAAVGGAVGAVCVLLILVIAVLVVVILLQRTRKWKKFSPNEGHELTQFHNPAYDHAATESNPPLWTH